MMMHAESGETFFFFRGRRCSSGLPYFSFLLPSGFLFLCSGGLHTAIIVATAHWPLRYQRHTQKERATVRQREREIIGQLSSDCLTWRGQYRKRSLQRFHPPRYTARNAEGFCFFYFIFSVYTCRQSTSGEVIKLYFFILFFSFFFLFQSSLMAPVTSRAKPGGVNRVKYRLWPM